MRLIIWRMWSGFLAANRDVDFVITAHRCFGEVDQVVQYAPEDLNLGFSVIATLKSRVYLRSITSALAIRRNLSLTLLPVLRHITPRWRMRADDCIVYGASLAGSQKILPRCSHGTPPVPRKE